MDPENINAYRAVALRCFACETRDIAERKATDDKNSSTAGLRYAVVERDA